MKTALGEQRPKSSKSLGASAYEQKKKKIITLQYAPGTLLEEKTIMMDLNIGRTPIREALLRLSGEGWVVIQTNRGAMVPPITLQETRAMFETLKILDLAIVPLLCSSSFTPELGPLYKANRDVARCIEQNDLLGLVEANHLFHLAFTDSARNHFLLRAVRDVRNQAKKLAYLSYSNDTAPLPSLSLQEHYKSVIHEHDLIIEAMKQRNEPMLESTLLKHINTFQQRIIAYMSA